MAHKNYYSEYLTRYYFANGSLCTSIMKIRSTNNGPLKFSCWQKKGYKNSVRTENTYYTYNKSSIMFNHIRRIKSWKLNRITLLTNNKHKNQLTVIQYYRYNNTHNESFKRHIFVVLNHKTNKYILRQSTKDVLSAPMTQ